MTKELEAKDFKRLDVDELYPIAEGSSRVLIGCKGSDYSASRIAVAVEDCDAHLLNLNVMNDPEGVHELLVDLRVDRRCAGGIARSLSRYGYDVLDFGSNGAGCEADDDSTLQGRVDELLRYINI